MFIKSLLRKLAPVTLAAGILVGGTALAAYASTGDGAQWRSVNYTNAPYFNAWGGSGGYLNAYDSSALNNDFTYVGPYSNGLYQIEFTPGNCTVGSNTCEVVADYGNNSGVARAGTYTNINGAPWGSYFSVGSCSVAGAPGHTFYNSHWGGYLEPSGDGSNGTAMYLNAGGASQDCWVTYPAA